MQEYLYDSIYFSVSKLHRNVSRIAEEEFKKIGLSPTYGLLLMLLDEWKELTPSQLSNYLDIKPSTTTRFLDKLQKLKLIKRRSDGRFSYISLTNQGVVKIHEVKGAYEGLEFRLNKKIGTRLSNRQKPILIDMAEKLSEK